MIKSFGVRRSDRGVSLEDEGAAGYLLEGDSAVDDDDDAAEVKCEVRLAMRLMVSARRPRAFWQRTQRSKK